MKLLIVTSRFYPTSSATSHCIQKLLPVFTAHGYEADILADTPADPAGLPQAWNGYRVFNIRNVPLSEIVQAKRPLKIIAALASKLAHRLETLVIPKYRHQAMNQNVMHTYGKALKRLIKAAALAGKPYDAILPTLCPLEATAATERWHGRIPWYLYMVDTYVDNETMPPQYQKNRMCFQRQVFASASALFTTPINCASPLFAPYRRQNKLVSVEFPCVVDLRGVPFYPPWTAERRVRCAYLGRFYPQVRTPDYLVALIASIQRHDLQFVFFGDEQDMVVKAPQYHQARERIVLAGTVSKEEADQAMVSADFLINIDNQMKNQVPSKIFDYISTGKPIVNLYCHEDSETLAYFRKYPLALNLAMDTALLQSNGERLQAFLEQNAGKQVPFPQVAEQFAACTPAYVAQQMMDRLAEGADT